MKTSFLCEILYRSKGVPGPFLACRRRLVGLHGRGRVMVASRAGALYGLRRINCCSLIDKCGRLFHVPTRGVCGGKATFRRLISLCRFSRTLQRLFLRCLLRVRQRVHSLLSCCFARGCKRTRDACLLGAGCGCIQGRRRNVSQLICRLRGLALAARRSCVTCRQGACRGIPL